MKLAALGTLVLTLVAIARRYLRSIGFSLKNTAGQSAPVESERQYVLRMLRDFLSGDGGERDWDDFTSCPLEDPKLDQIRIDAASVDLPLDEAGYAKLSQLLEQAEGRTPAA
jgi:hypothetical protein